VLKFKLKGINQLDVIGARFYSASGNRKVSVDVIRHAITEGTLKVRRTLRQSRSDRSPKTPRRRRPKLVVTTSRALTGVTPISGTTYYVSAGGSNGASGRSPGAAWRTVGRANAASLHPGDGVLFEGGRTFEDTALSPERSGTADKPIVYGSYGSGDARLPKGIYMLDVSGLAFQYLEVSGPAQAVLASEHGQSSDITIERMTISDTRIGINVANDVDKRWTIRENQISHTGDSGMILLGTDFSVTGNAILDTGNASSIDYAKHGIYLKVVNARVSYNTIHDFESSGVSVRNRNSVVEHNDISGGQQGITWYQFDPVAGTSYWRYNTISGTTDAGIYVSREDEAGPTRESFVITNNTLSKRAGVYTDLQPTAGTYAVSGNNEN
jgi:hypothetical protein